MRSDRPAWGLEDTARLVGAYRWMAQRLFATAGSWTTTSGDPEVRVHLDGLSLELGWHAELWQRRLPVLDHLDQEALTRPAGAMEALLAAVDEVVGASPAALGDPVRLAALHRVTVPRLLVTYRLHARHAAPVADGPLLKVLQLAGRDLTDAWVAGEALLERLTCTVEAVEAVAQVQRRLELAVVAGGLGAGLVPWPEPPGSSGR